MPQESVFLERAGADGDTSVRAATHTHVAVLATDSLEATQEARYRPWGFSGLRAAVGLFGTFWASEAQRKGVRQGLEAMLEEEVAYGHGFLFAPVLVGLGAIVWFQSPVDPPAVVLVSLSVLFSLVVAVGHHRGGRSPLLPLAILLVLAGALLAQVETWRRSTVLLDSPVTTMVMGEVERREAAGAGRWRYFIRLTKTVSPELRRPPEQIVLLARSAHDIFAAGEIITGRARLSPPSGPALPRLNDFAFGSYFDGIGAVGFFYGAPVRPENLPPEITVSPAGLERRTFALRGAIAERIRATVPGDAGAFAAAIVTGERRAISSETTEALRVSGLAHIIAISGLHMALAAGVFFVGLRICLGWFTGFAQAWPIKKIAAFGALLMAASYYVISGFAVSAERAYLMMAVMLIAVFFDRAAISLRNVAISALIILAMSPSEVMGPSFQMSFAATVALVAGYAAWSRRPADPDGAWLAGAKGRFAPLLIGWQFLVGIFITSLIGGLSTAIHSMEHFHRLSGYGLAANLAVMPIISFLVMPAGLVGMLLMPFGLDGPFLTLMGQGLSVVIVVAKEVASWGGDLGVGRQHPWFLAMASGGFLLLTLLRTRLRLVGLPLMALAFALSWHAQRQPPPDLLISEDGALVALVGTVAGSAPGRSEATAVDPGSGTAVATNRARPPRFIFGQWQRALMLDDPIKPLMSPAGDIAAVLATEGSSRQRLDAAQMARIREAMADTARQAGQRRGLFHCLPKAWCLAVTQEGAIIAVMEDGRLTGTACDLATLVVAPRAGFGECRSGALLVDGRTLRKTGALEIHLNGRKDTAQWRVTTAMAAAADRPWTRHRLYDWRSERFDGFMPARLSAMISGSGE